MIEPKRKTGTSSDGREMHYSVGIIVEHDGRHLLLDRVSPPPGFASPAGHIDEGEEPMIAALREETGITLSDLELVTEEEILWNYCKSATVHYWYLYKTPVDSDHVVLKKDEEKSIGWYTSKEMKDMTLEEIWSYWFKKLNIL